MTYAYGREQCELVADQVSLLRSALGNWHQIVFRLPHHTTRTKARSLLAPLLSQLAEVERLAREAGQGIEP